MSDWDSANLREEMIADGRACEHGKPGGQGCWACENRALNETRARLGARIIELEEQLRAMGGRALAAEQSSRGFSQMYADARDRADIAEANYDKASTEREALRKQVIALGADPCA